LVAKSVEAPRYRESPPLSTAYYAYWDGMTLDRAEIYNRERRAIGAWPTDEGLVLTYVAAPIAEFETFQRDPEGAMMAALDLVPDLGQRVRAARRVERMHGSRDLPNFFRKPFGPGWALVGDAGFVLDPVTAQGIGNGLRDSELLAEAIVTGLGGTIPLEAALERYQNARDEAALPMYEFTLDLVAFKPWTIEEAVTFQSLVGRPALTEQLFSVLTGSSPMSHFLRPRNILRVLGLRGLGEVAYRRISRGLARRRARRLAARMPERQEAA
jgi:2-polyprenyl-6-methoxyphenol hydroxylase-like FAD-dependent oxidoreductase